MGLLRPVAKISGFTTVGVVPPLCTDINHSVRKMRGFSWSLGRYQDIPVFHGFKLGNANFYTEYYLLVRLYYLYTQGWCVTKLSRKKKTTSVVQRSKR
jgi:hypothetical protein